MKSSVHPPRPRRALAFALTLAVPLLAGPAHAGLVDIVGGFRGYEGPLQTPNGRPNGLQSTFSTPDLTFPASPTDPIPGCVGCARVGIGLGVAGFYGGPIPMPQRVEFYQDRPVDPPPRNVIAFAPATGTSVQVGDTFKLGTFTLTNGGWLGGFPDGQFEIQLHTVSATPALDGHYMDVHVGFHVTTGLSADERVASAEPADNADYFYIAEHPEFGYVGVYESEPQLQPPGGSNTGTIDFYGRMGSLIPTGFANPQGVLLLPSIPVVASSVPEPAGWASLLAGLAVVGGLARRRDSASRA